MRPRRLSNCHGTFEQVLRETKGRRVCVSGIPYRNAGALLVLQRVVLAPRATVPVLHDGWFRANVSRSSIDLSRGIDGRPPSLHVAMLRICIFNRRRRAKRMAGSSSLRGPSHRKDGIRRRGNVRRRRRRHPRVPRSSFVSLVPSRLRPGRAKLEPRRRANAEIDPVVCAGVATTQRRGLILRPGFHPVYRVFPEKREERCVTVSVRFSSVRRALTRLEASKNDPPRLVPHSSRRGFAEDESIPQKKTASAHRLYSFRDAPCILDGSVDDSTTRLTMRRP